MKKENKQDLICMVIGCVGAGIMTYWAFFNINNNEQVFSNLTGFLVKLLGG